MRKNLSATRHSPLASFCEPQNLRGTNPDIFHGRKAGTPLPSLSQNSARFFECRSRVGRIRSGVWLNPIAPDYGQQFLFPPALEDWVAARSSARASCASSSINSICPRCTSSCRQASEGRPPFAPSLLLKIWLYGYFQRIRATRKLEAACRDQLPLLLAGGTAWRPGSQLAVALLARQQKALRAVFKQTVQVALQTGCGGAGLPGARWHEDPSRRQRLLRLEQRTDGKASDGAGRSASDQTELKIMEENAAPDAPGAASARGSGPTHGLARRDQKGLAQLAADGRGHYHPVEPEARRMKVNGGNRFAYNAQALADARKASSSPAKPHARKPTPGNWCR